MSQRFAVVHEAPPSHDSSTHSEGELLVTSAEGPQALDLFPFISIQRNRLHYYNRTRAVGFEYRSVFGTKGHEDESTKQRKFSHAALRTTKTTD
jgi:hypothetical protein